MKSWDALGTLLGGYFHEDFVDIYGSAWSAVEDFALSQPEYAPQLRREITEILAVYPLEADLERALYKLGLCYLISYDGWKSHRTWLLAVADRVDDILQRSPAA